VYSEDLLNLIKNKNYSSFCELGAGRGTTTMYLAKYGYSDLTMVDLAEQGFEVAKYSFEKFKLSIPKMIIADVEKTNIKEESFDCIYNIGLLEHFDDPRPTLEESYRLLNKVGLIYMPIVPVQPQYKSFFQRLMFNPLSLIKNIIRSKSKENNINRTDYPRSFYAKICKEIGYKNIKCIPYNHIGKLIMMVQLRTNLLFLFINGIIILLKKERL
jgi:ubiquinone/menaquinone biosynthesis C-methylase UbiE